jgi:hypothetical protein
MTMHSPWPAQGADDSVVALTSGADHTKQGAQGVVLSHDAWGVNTYA